MSDEVVSLNTEAALAEWVAAHHDNLEGFVMGAFPWGRKETFHGEHNPLRTWSGPNRWQRRWFRDLDRHIRDNSELVKMGLWPEVWRSATATGHDVGKTACLGQFICAMMSTRADLRGVVTATTEDQIKNTTWPELSKWHNLLINRHWFVWTATTFYFAQYPENRRKNYMMTAATVSKDRTEAIAGLHNEGKTVLVIFDEASGVHDKVWEVVEGALMDGEAFFVAMGNPTRPEGSFFDCFDRHGDLYRLEHIDSRDVAHSNPNAHRDTIRKFGEDSDETRVRVYGQFPRQSLFGYIGVDTVVGAQERTLTADSGAALIMGVDVAHVGRDSTIICFRQGRDARSRPMMAVRKMDNVQIANVLSEQASRFKPDAIVIESTGPGRGVIDIMKHRGYRMVEVHPGAPGNDFKHFTNRRAELWHDMREWLIAEGCITDDAELYRHLTSVDAFMDGGEQKLLLASKKKMRSEGKPSPDKADALALTFGAKVPRRDSNLLRGGANHLRQAVLQDDPLAVEV